MNRSFFERKAERPGAPFLWALVCLVLLCAALLPALLYIPARTVSESYPAPEISRRFFGGRDAGRILSFPKRETVLKQHGRTVLCVRSEGGTFYYKPRDCSVDAFFHDLTAKHFADVTCAPDVIEGDGFGFCTELVRKPVEKAEDIGRYFYNFGALTALYLGLNGGDLHAKNILACGIYPASIDLEDLFTPEIRTPGTRFMTAGEKAGKRSLAMMAVLPSRDFLTDSFTSTRAGIPGLPTCRYTAGKHTTSPGMRRNTSGDSVTDTAECLPCGMKSFPVWSSAAA